MGGEEQGHHSPKLSSVIRLSALDQPRYVATPHSASGTGAAGRAWGGTRILRLLPLARRGSGPRRLDGGRLRRSRRPRRSPRARPVSLPHPRLTPPQTSPPRAKPAPPRPPRGARVPLCSLVGPDVLSDPDLAASRSRVAAASAASSFSVRRTLSAA